jgi:ADP-heptose:LPS heptosyltransferase
MSGLADFQPRRILVCQQRQIGDVLLITPALQCLRERFPAASIHVLTERKCLSMLERNPHVDRVWLLDKAIVPTLWHEVRWFWQVARTGYDLVINFQPSLPRLRWVVAFSGARARLAAAPPWYLRFLYTHATPAPAPGSYAARTKVGVLAPLGIHWRGERPRLYLAEEERIDAAALLDDLGLRDGQTLITVDPTHRQPTRRWPLEHYARLLALLAARGAATGLDLRFLPLWGPGEEKDIRELLALARAQACAERLLLPERMLSLREMAACMERAALHIGNCSAPRHMAVAVGTRSCIAHGSTGQEWTCPSAGNLPDHLGLAAGLDCQPCEANHCGLAGGASSAPCLRALAPERLAEAAFGLLPAR